MRRKLATGLIPGLLVLLFMYTSFSKLFALETFKGTLDSQPIPHALAPPLMVLIPAAELFTAVALLFEQTKRAGLYSAITLLIVFTLYIAAILLHLFHKTPCSCGGIFRHLSWGRHFWINILFTGLAMIALLFRTKKSIPSQKNHL
jgi:putative oxidoreductase